MSNSLSAYHALNGCDYSASFSIKEKIKPFKFLENDVGNFSQEIVTEEDPEASERYVSSL